MSLKRRVSVAHTLLSLVCWSCAGADAPQGISADHTDAAPIHPPTSVDVTLSPEGSQVYRVHTKGFTQYDEGEPFFHEDHTTLRIEADPWGKLRIQNPIDVDDIIPLERLSPSSRVHFLFPSFEQPLDWEVRDQSFVIKGMGSSPRFLDPDREIAETIELRGVNGDLATFGVTREARLPGRDSQTKLHQQMELVFDTAQRRYNEVTFEITVEEQTAGTVGRKVRLVFDEALTTARARRLAELQKQAQQARQGYDDYLSAHPVDQDIARVVAIRSKAPRHHASMGPDDLLSFYTHRYPAKVWRQALKLPIGQERRAVLGNIFGTPLGGELPDEVVSLISKEIRRDEYLRHITAFTRDPRFRNDLEWMEKTQTGVIKTLATEALSQLTPPPTAEEVEALLSKGPSQYLDAAGNYLAQPDARAIIPSLIEGLTKGESVAYRAGLYLEELCHDYPGEDPAAWQALWQAHKNETIEQWTIRGTKAAQRGHRVDAIRALGRMEPFDEGAEALLAALGSDDDAYRVNAAMSLAQWRHPAAAPVLIGYLEFFYLYVEHPIIFLHLAQYGDHMLGWRAYPEDPDENVPALARWKEWAARRGSQ